MAIQSELTRGLLSPLSYPLFMNKDLKLSDFRLNRKLGNISREEYWLKVQESLSTFTSLQSLFSNKITKIEVFSDKMVLDYSITSDSNLRMFLDPQDLRSAPMTIICEGSYEPLLSKILFQAGKNARTFLDVGANAGFYSLSLAILYPSVKIFSFDPNVDVTNLLSQNMEINNLRNRITVVNTAVGSKLEESKTLFIPKLTGTGGGSLNNLHPEEGRPVTREIKVDTLDNYIGNMEPIDLIKIDVEGFELEVIKGSEKLIEKWHPIIFVELLRKWMAPFSAHPQDVLNFLGKKDYFCFSISEEKISRVNVIDANTYETNFIFVHQADQINLDLLNEYMI